MTSKKLMLQYLIYFLLTFGAVVVLFPMAWMLLTAMKHPGLALKFIFAPQPGTPYDTWGSIYTLDNLWKVFKEFDFAKYFLNSLLVASTAAFFATFFAALASYAFAKKDFFMRDQLFYLLAATTLIPGMMYLVPQFVIVIKLGWFDSYKGLIIPHLASVFGVFMMRQYMQTIPSSLIEAAQIDGASEWQIFRIVVLPLALPIVTTLFLLTFLFHWSNFIWQLVITKPGSTLLTIPVGLAYFSGPHGSDWEVMMAAALFSVVPIAILFLLAQRTFIEGMTSGAVKG